jgi:hypothetical protein
MPIIETTLHASYQLNEWHLREAAREIISNAIDGEERNKAEGRGKMTVAYSKRKKVLTVTNSGVKVPTKALLMGTSESRESADCIGTFGEGLPMALLVLARKGLPVVIYNGDEKWEPSIQKSSTFSGEPVLVIKTRQMIKDRGAFVVEMHDIEPEEADELQAMFLRLDPDFDSEQVAKKNPWDRELVLLQPEYKGKVYNKGVFVLERDDLLFGYNIDTELNRDRHMISEWKLQDQLGTVLTGAVRHNPDTFADELIDALMSGAETLESRDTYSSLTYNDEFGEALLVKWREKFGNNALAVANIDEAKQAEFLGHRGIVVSPLLRKLIGKQLGTLEEIRGNHDRMPTLVYDLGTLEHIELRHLHDAVGLVASVFPEWKQDVRVVEFGSRETMGTFLESTGRIDLARWVLASFHDTLVTLVHEFSHSMGEDGSKDHGDMQIEVMAQIIERLLSDARDTASIDFGFILKLGKEG